MQLYDLQPSLMGNVLSACDPADICDRNFGLINARFNLALPPTNTDAVDEDNAATVVQANFASIAAATGLALLDVTAGPQPEVLVQANFETINAAW